MKFPFEPTAVEHKHGGKITKVTGVGHGIDRPADGRSRDYWHFFGDVTWRDGTKSAGLEIAPWALCQDSVKGLSEINDLMAAMNHYLYQHGEWCDSASKHEGWYAHVRKIRRRA